MIILIVCVLIIGYYAYKHVKEDAEEEKNRIWKGITIISGGVSYEGQYKGNKFCGQGTLIYPDGMKYVGEFEDGKKHGQGTITMDNGNKVVGEFNRDEPWNSTLVDKDDKYIWSYRSGETPKTGEWERSFYLGEWKDGKFHGQGTHTYPEGDKYEGEWKDGEQTKGTYTYPEGHRYEGEWKNKTFHGKGTLFFNDGDKYEGNFKDGEKTKGIMTYSNGEKYLVEFKNHVEVKRTKCDKNGKIIKKKEKKGKK